MFFSDNATDSDTCWPCCASGQAPFVTHKCLTGGAAGGTEVWYADRGGLNGLPTLKSNWQYATCWRIRIDGTQVYTAGDRSLDPFVRADDPEVYYKSCYILRDVLVGIPSSFTLYMDASAGASFRLTVTLRDHSGTTVGSGDTLPLPVNVTATDVLNAIEAACDSDSGGTFVPSGAFSVTGGPLPGTPVVMSPAGAYAGTYSTIEFPPDPEVQQITSGYRNSVEAWDKTDGTNVWKVSLNNGASQLFVEGSTLFVGQHIYGYFTDCGPAFCYPVYYFDSSGNLTCWDGNLAGVGPNKILAPDPVDGYSLIKVGTGVAGLTAPLPWNMTASQLSTALAAAGHGATCTGGPLPGTPINVSGTPAPTYCVTSDTLIGPFDAGIALRLLSTADGSQIAQSAWGQPIWGQLNGQAAVTAIAKSGSTVYVSGSGTGGYPTYSTGPSTFCRADGVNTRKFDTSLNPLGDLDGAIGSGGAWSVCFNTSTGYCYSASANGVLAIGPDFKTGGFAFTDTGGGHLLPAGYVAIKSDNSIVVATWSNQVGTFSPSTGTCIAQTTLPDVNSPVIGALGGFNEVCVDDNGFIYVAIAGREVGFTALPGCVMCFDSSLTLQWRFDYENSDGTVFGQALTICCEPDGSYVYFGGTRIPVGPRP